MGDALHIAGARDVALNAGLRRIADWRSMSLWIALALYCALGLTGFDP